MSPSRLRAALFAVAFAGCAAVSTAAPARADIAGAVRGTLERSDHHPIPNVVVTLTGTGVTLRVTTGADGTFTFARVPFGTYALRASTPDGDATDTVDVATGGVVDVTLLAAHVIGGTRATATGVRGTPVSENTLGTRQIAALPVNTSVDRVIETLPGIVRFSYDEPVAHGFHGITYELDGAPLPSSTSSNFANLIDPRDAGAIEVFTGAFPAEFGGSRMGAVVNVQSLPFENPPGPGTLLLGTGEQGTEEAQLVKRFNVGRAQVTIAADNLATDRGLDTPSSTAIHDASSTTNQFLRIALPMGARDTLAFDVANQYATYQIPINTDPNDLMAGEVSLPSQDDVQREYDRFAAASYTHLTRDGNGYFRIVPWTRYDRVVYDGDLAADVQGVLLGTDVSPQSCPVPVGNGNDCPSNGVVQDRAATYAGLRLSAGRTSARHTLTYGLDLQQENFHSDVTIAFAPAENPNGPAGGNFVDDTAQKGSATSAFVQDVWALSPAVTIKPGLRYDRSTGYVSGSQLSPRFEIDAAVAPHTIVHAYAGRFYAAPGLEDTRREAVITQTSPTANPVYDLQPERDTYVELGVAHDFGGGRRAYVNAFDRTVVNVLDTTNLLDTPLFAVYNSAVGVTRGIEGRYVQSSARGDAGVSFTYSRSLAGGVSGGTFLFAPPDVGDLTLQPEDHDETYVGDAFVTRRFGAERATFATLETQYGSGFPVAFLDGTAGRLPAHFSLNAALGRTASAGRLGYELSVDNLTNHRYPIKVENGFNTTQWNAPRRIVFRLIAPW